MEIADRSPYEMESCLSPNLFLVLYDPVVDRFYGILFLNATV